MMRAFAAIALLAGTAHAQPAGFARAIEAFNDGECAGAIVQITEVARTHADADAATRGRVLLWQAGILSRCDQLDEANRVLDVLVREQPEIRVDLAEWWPSLAELVDAARARNPRPGATEVRVVEPVAPSPAPRVSPLEFGVVLIPVAGHETKEADTSVARLGTGLEISAAFDRGNWHAGLEARTLRYAPNDMAIEGGWELGATVRGGARKTFGSLALTAHGTVAASIDQPVEARRIGFGFGGTATLHVTRRFHASLSGDWLPVGFVAVDGTRADAVTSVLAGAHLGWQASPRWHFELGAALDQHETDLRDDGMMRHRSDTTIRLVVGAQHRY